MSKAVSASGIVIVLAAVVGLSGCDIAPDVRLTGAPINDNNGGTLDPEAPENITGYFYTDRAVEGLIYNCVNGAQATGGGNTDSNGAFLCPRTSSVSFYVGRAGEFTLKLGTVDLAIYGDASDPDRRNHVAVTPGTLYGTATDGQRAEVANIFNLLTSLDSVIDRTTRRQPTLALTSLTHQLFSDAVLGTAGSPLRGATPLRSLSPSSFAAALEPIVTEVDGSSEVTLVWAAGHVSPVLSALEAESLANAALLRARVGLYRNTTYIYGVKTGGGGVLSAMATFQLGNSGTVSGYVYTDEVLSGGTTTRTISVLEYVDGEVRPDGTLVDFLFRSSGAQTMTMAGSLVNDALYGELELCGTSYNTRIPSSYCNDNVSGDGFQVADAGSYVSSQGYDGELYMARVAEGLPDIDLDLLPAAYLPRTFEMTLGRYTDIQRSELVNAAYMEVDDDKTVFGIPVSPVPTVLRYTILDNGDVVADSDADCASLTLVAGEWRDDDRVEPLIGKVGNVFEVSTKAYLTLNIAVLDPAHPWYGLSVGYASMARPNLYAMALRAEDGQLLSKSCDPDATCTDRIEWFNDHDYILNVLKPDAANGDDPVADAALYKDETFYGQVVGNVAVAGVGGICPP